MLDELSASAAASSLAIAAEDASLSTSARAHARELGERLMRGVRIVLLGPKGVGKSELCNALLSRADAALSSETRIFGEPHGVQDLPWLATASHAGTTEEAGLGHIQFIDLACPAQFNADNTLIGEALEGADIVLWCTQTFGPDERQMWERASDHLKDHSFLVLTKADLLIGDAVLDARMSELEAVAQEEFHSFFPTTTRLVRAAQTSGEAVPDALLAASGIRALVDTMGTLVRSGLRADLDSALLFLERHNFAVEESLESNGRNSDFGQKEEGAVKEAEGQNALSNLRARLLARINDLTNMDPDALDDLVPEMIDLCGEIAEDLVVEMREVQVSRPEMSKWADAFEDASDKIMLLALERDARSAADALTIVLQLKRDLDQLSGF